VTDYDELYRSMAKRGRQANLSLFRLHGHAQTQDRENLRAGRRALRQVHDAPGYRRSVHPGCAEELHHLRRLLQISQGMPGTIPRSSTRKRPRRWRVFMRLHPYNIAQKTEVMVEHFNAVTRHRIGGKAKAMVVTGSRLEAVRYKQSFDRYNPKKRAIPSRPWWRFLGNRLRRQDQGQDLH